MGDRNACEWADTLVRDSFISSFRSLENAFGVNGDKAVKVLRGIDPVEVAMCKFLRTEVAVIEARTQLSYARVWIHLTTLGTK